MAPSDGILALQAPSLVGTFGTTGDLVADLAQLKERWLAGRTLPTVRAYEHCLGRFCFFMQAPTVAEALAALLRSGLGPANEMAHAFRAWMVDSGRFAPRTINLHLSALRSVVALARRFGIVPWAIEVDNVESVPYRDTAGPSADAVRAMLRASRGDRPKALRDRAIVRLAHDRGLRRSEIVGLDREHVDLDAGTVSVRRKRRREREIMKLPPAALKAAREWIAARGDGPGPLFCNLDPGHATGRLTPDGIYKVICALGNKVGVVARPHGLRHRGITAALDVTGGDLRAAQRFSGHRDPKTIMLYDDNRQDIGFEVAKKVSATLDEKGAEVAATLK